jgi:hypothetical protein
LMQSWFTFDPKLAERFRSVGIAVSGWPVEALGQGEEPAASGDERGGGNVRREAFTILFAR